MPKGVGYSGDMRAVRAPQASAARAPGGASGIQELIGKAVVNKKLTKAQGTTLMRHRKHHTQGHMLLMMRMMIEKNYSFKDAHEHATAAVGR